MVGQFSHAALILLCVCLYRQRLETEFASQAKFVLKPHMMLCTDEVY